jgi:hypothetical protein
MKRLCTLCQLRPLYDDELFCKQCIDATFKIEPGPHSLEELMAPSTYSLATRVWLKIRKFGANLLDWIVFAIVILFVSFLFQLFGVEYRFPSLLWPFNYLWQ